jgi:hypothetical protein
VRDTLVDVAAAASGDDADGCAGRVLTGDAAANDVPVDMARGSTDATAVATGGGVIDAFAGSESPPALFLRTAVTNNDVDAVVTDVSGVGVDGDDRLAAEGLGGCGGVVAAADDFDATALAVACTGAVAGALPRAELDASCVIAKRRSESTCSITLLISLPSTRSFGSNVGPTTPIDRQALRYC